MTAEPPIACSLSAAELSKRLEEMSAVGRDALLGVLPDGTLRFRADERTRERLDRIIAAESLCCSFLRFDLAEESGELRLSVTAPEGAEPLASDLVDAFGRP